MATQNELIVKLVSELKANPHILDYARNFGNAIVNGPADHCAATLSALMIFAGIYPTGTGAGHSNMEPWVPSLANDLEKKNAWMHIPLGGLIKTGDVGVVIASATVHHIYLVMDAADQAAPMVADNQKTTFHARAVAGDPAQSFSPTSYFLRAN